jgi:type II secretion system protein G
MALTEPAARSRRTVPLLRIARRDEAGFTLIELLVVMIIIGVLASISVPVFLNQRKKAVDTQLKSDLRSVAVSVETYFTDNSAYPASISQSGVSLTITTGMVVRLSSGDAIAYTTPARTGAANTYCLVASNTGASQNWVYISDKGGLQPSGTTACS